MDLSEQALIQLSDAFHVFDKNNDGCIDAEELGDVIRMLGYNPTEAEIRHMIAEVDANDNGKIDFEEFVTLMSSEFAEAQKGRDPNQELRAAFAVFDQNGDGKISVEELRSVLTKLGEALTDQEVEDMMREADVNGDGELDYGEFVDSLVGM